MVYTDKEKARFLVWFIEEEYDYAKLKTRIRREANNWKANAPDNKLVKNWLKAFLETGTVHGQAGKGTSKWVSTLISLILLFRRLRTEEIIEEVHGEFMANPHSSTRRNAFMPTGETDSEEDEERTRLSRTTLRRILKLDLKMRPYHLQMVHALREQDHVGRVAFARDELSRLEADPGRLANWFFSDEAFFHLDGGVNRQDWILWADENPHWFDERRLHPEKLCVWIGIGVEGVVGPFFWQPQNKERGINAQWMTELYQQQVFPILQNWPNFNELVFQQDGARPHSANVVLSLLDQTFPDRWVGNGTADHPAPVAWPPYSPDLTACDYWLWGYMKAKIYHRDQRPGTLADLRAAIVEIAEEIRQDRGLRERVIGNFPDRLRRCVERQGGQVEIR
jgi:hypothetical protein